MNDRTLVEVDGLLAAFIYLDHTEASVHRNLTCTNAICHDSTTTPVYNAANAQSLSITDAIRAPDLAWTSARAVRDEIQMLWDRFVEVSRGLDVAVINNLRSGYEDAKGLRYAAVFAYRNALTGLRPNDLARMFALSSLSYVAHRILHAQGRLLQDSFLTGIHMWRDSLEDEDERRAFDQLSSHLWLEGQNHLSSMNMDSEEPSHYFTHTVKHDESTSLSLASYAQQHPDSQGTSWSFDLLCESDSLSLFLANGQSTNDLNAWAHGLESFTDLTNGEPSLNKSGPPTEYDIWPDLGSVHSLEFNIPGILDSRTHESPVAQPPTDSRFDTNPLHEPGDLSLAGRTTSAVSLQTPHVYMAIQEFIHDDGQFWFQLAGRGLVSKNIASCQSWCQERWGQKKHIRTSYIQKLLSSRRTQGKTSSGIISIVDTFVDWGFLQSIENIEFYMEGLADLLFDDNVAGQEFRDWARASSGSGKGKLYPCPDCTYSSKWKHNTTRHRAHIHENERNERSNKRQKAIKS